VGAVPSAENCHGRSSQKSPDCRRATLRREKQIKEWKRDWKTNLIEHENRHWVDLLPTLTI
jgi:predicted GIY-YIG superfamily endonuclease